MLDFNAWLGTNNNTRPSASDRAVAAWDRIQDKPSSVVLVRSGTAQPEQTVRIEYAAEVSEPQGKTDGGLSSKRILTIFGIRDHPTLDDTDIQRGDRFAYEGLQFRVIDLLLTLGEIQARAEVMS